MQKEDEIIERHINFTKAKVTKLKSEIKKIESENWCLMANGSYARHEASENSDFDFYLLYKPEAMTDKQVKATLKRTVKIIESIVGRLPSQDGAFNSTLKLGELTKNIGGEDDINSHITKRILFLTEGLAINNDALYRKQRDELIDRYVAKNISDHQLGMFLLNDLIRYYRTVCVDFEFKTVEDNKPWGIRNIKLIFSRKLLYFSGILIAAEMAQRSYQEKLEIFRDLCTKTPLDRIRTVCGSSADRAIKEYTGFLEAIESPAIRRMLEQINPSEKPPEDFRRLKNSGHHFSFHLMSALKATYSESHPIHRALLL
ncbi:MAG: DUF294 nucleotidyltransferase-like domain-containing protein [Xanthobacteraceae bacterium]